MDCVGVKLRTSKLPTSQSPAQLCVSPMSTSRRCSVLDGASRHRTNRKSEPAFKCIMNIRIVGARHWRADCYSFSDRNDRLAEDCLSHTFDRTMSASLEA